MEEQQVHRCATCPAYLAIPGSGTAGTCRALPPTVLQGEKFFRGSSRDMWFGTYPAVGAFPLVQEEDYCMRHPGNRQVFPG